MDQLKLNVRENRFLHVFFWRMRIPTVRNVLLREPASRPTFGAPHSTWNLAIRPGWGQYLRIFYVSYNNVIVLRAGTSMYGRLHDTVYYAGTQIHLGVEYLLYVTIRYYV